MADESLIQLDEDQKISIKNMECPDESILNDVPWAQELLKTGVELTRKSILLWIRTALIIGDLDMDDYCKIFIKNVDHLFADMILDMESLKEKKMNNIAQFMSKFDETCKDLQVPLPFNRTLYDGSAPLSHMYNILQDQFVEYEKQGRKRRTQVAKLNKRQEEIARALGRKLEPLGTRPLPTVQEIEKFEERLDQLENERMDRELELFAIRDEFAKIVANLEAELILNDFEIELLHANPTTLKITDRDNEQLRRAHQRLVDKRSEIAESVDSYWNKINGLWATLETDLTEQNRFRRDNSGVTLGVLKLLRQEHRRLQGLMRENMSLFVEKLRIELRNIWEKCYRVETDEIEHFKCFCSRDYCEDLLDLHQREIDKWNNYYVHHRDIILTLEEYQALWTEMEALEVNSHATGMDRYKNRGGKLLIEEKTRKKLERRIPKLRQKLIDLTECYEEENGFEFRTFGKTISDYLQQLKDFLQQHVEETKLSAKKTLRDRSRTPDKSLMVTPRPTTMPKIQRKFLTPATDQFKLKKVRTALLKRRASTGAPKLNVTTIKRLSKEMRKHRMGLSKKKSNRSDEENDTHMSTSDPEFNNFTEELSRHKDWRSTVFQKPEIVITEATPCAAPSAELRPPHVMMTDRSLRDRSRPGPSRLPL